MCYLTLHHGTFWFQIRVPAFARTRFGELVRINLQTADRTVAKSLGLRLAAEWFTKFSLAAAGEVAAIPGSDAWTPVLLPEAPVQAMEARPGTSLAQAFTYWRDLTPGRPERSVMEFERTAELFDERIDKPLAALVRGDIAAFRDSLLKDGLAWATVRKRMGFVSAMLQAQYDAGRLAANVARVSTIMET